MGSGFAVKPGATSGYDFSSASTKDSTSTRDSPHDVGEAWIDHGSRCDGQAGKEAGCFLDDNQRMRLVIEFRELVGMARSNYHTALTHLRMDKLVEKEEDLHWAVAFALDLAGAHVVSALTTALKHRSAGLAKAASLGQRDLSKVKSMLARVTPGQIDAIGKQGFDLGKTAGKKVGKNAQNKGALDDKSATLGFLSTLQNTCDRAFLDFARSASANADDAELIVLWVGMQPEHHAPDIYKDALDSKIDRFKKSGVPDIGEGVGKDGDGLITREKRVVYVQDMHGKKVPWYQNGDQGMFGGQQLVPRHEYLERPVPEEFREIAVARSEAVWGRTPIIDDGYSKTFHKESPHEPTTGVEAAMQAFSHYTDPHPKPAPMAFAGATSVPLEPLPSVFDSRRKL